MCQECFSYTEVVRATKCQHSLAIVVGIAGRTMWTNNTTHIMSTCVQLCVKVIAYNVLAKCHMLKIKHLKKVHIGKNEPKCITNKNRVSCLPPFCRM